MNGLIFAIFFFILALVLASISLGSKVIEDQRRRKVKGVLDTASGISPEPAGPNVLRATEEPDAIGRILSQTSLEESLRASIQQSGLEWSAPKLIILMLGFALCGAIIGYFFPLLLIRWLTVVVFGVIFGSLPLINVRWKRKKRLDALEAQFPEALDFLARSLRAGHAFTISMEMLGEESPDPLGQEIRILSNEHNLGAPLETALTNFTHRVPILDVQFFVSSVLLQRQTGGNLSEILIRLAYVIRERFRLKGQVKAASAHGRITATILTLLPIATALLLFVIAPGYLQSMVKDPDGKWLLVSAVCAQALGYYCMRRIINIKV